MNRSYQSSNIIRTLVLVLLVVATCILMVQSQKPEEKPITSSISTNNKSISSSSNRIILTKAAVDELVRKAADQKYLQDVLADGPKLPIGIHKEKPMELLPNRDSPSSVNTGMNTESPSTPQMPQQISQRIQSDRNSQRCIYNGTTYSLGEIVQIDKGWIRCTPSIVFSTDGASHYSNAVWTLRDSLL